METMLIAVQKIRDPTIVSNTANTAYLAKQG